MKTQNSTQWCNIYLSASKYNINVKYSRYKLAIYSFSVILLCLILLISFTFYYVIAQVIALAAIISLSLFLSKSNNNAIAHSFVLTYTGGLCFDKDPLSYHLLTTSRLGFIGCWLIMVPSELTLNQCGNTNNTSPKQLFIFRDSISGQDFSRLARVIKQLGEVT